ncbi:MAG: hypothetical protein H0T60_19245, partial [Acidobacteria bacterium]|nr:hypothetical protein [Acidobacteriota bacterium]
MSGQLPNVLPREEVIRVYREGVRAWRAGLQFHEGPYAKAAEDVPDDEYQRGMEWRRGWNQQALAARDTGHDIIVGCLRPLAAHCT